MCAYSMMVDAFKQVPMPQWTPPAWNDAQEILRRIAELDRKLGQADCADPSKAVWMKEVEERLKKLETK